MVFEFPPARCLLLCVITLLPRPVIGDATADERPNILLILADDVGTDAIGCYGGRSYPTRHIDDLAAGGMTFNHGYAMPVCHPTRICLMTGRYPFRFGKAGMKWGDFPKAVEGNSIGNCMKQGGYATAVAGKWQLCMMKNDLDHPARTGFDEWCLFGWHEGGRYHDPLIYQNGSRRLDTSGRYGPDLYVEFLIDFMRRNHRAGKPFFAYYPMALCHDVTDDLKGRLVAYYRDDRWMNYGEMVASMDDMIGRLVAALDEMGARKNTLIVFTTDNGTAASSYLRVNGNGKMVKHEVVSVQHGNVVRGGKGKLDDTGTRVPLIANWPGRIEPGAVVDDMVDMTDYLPTLVDVAGLEDDGVPRDGISFASRLLGRGAPTPQRQWVYFEHRGKRCVRAREWKLYGDGRFFNLTDDPRESTPIETGPLTGEAEGRPETRRNRNELTRLLKSLNGPLALENAK